MMQLATAQWDISNGPAFEEQLVTYWIQIYGINVLLQLTCTQPGKY